MDCMQACEIISAAHDGELVDAAMLEQARIHAHACAECAAFVRVLDRVAAVPAPEAPPELVTRISEMAAAISADARRTADRADEPEVSPQTARHERGRLDWIPRIAALASVAAVVLVVISAGGIALLSRTGQTAEEAVLTETTSDEALRGTPEPSAGDSEAAASLFAGAPAQPAFVSLDSGVWVLAGVASPGLPPLTSAGSVQSSLGGSASLLRGAFYAGDDRSVLYVIGEDGTYLAFDRVVRTFGGIRYGLVTGAPLDSFGAWPTLPGRFGSPVAADGSPAFESAGYDDRGIQVFVPHGATATAGFAVAPGTAPDDPAAGNPGWTWWEPLP